MISVRLLLACWLLSAIGLRGVNHEILVIVGSPGEPKYEAGFNKAADTWKEAAKVAGAALTLVGVDADGNLSDKDQVSQWIQGLDKHEAAPAWIVYIGHGTYNRRDAYLNVRGPDISATELGGWLPVMDRTLIFIHGGSASSPFLKAMAGKNRIILSATRNPDEINYARFGEYFAQIISTTDGDIDQDGQTSLLEAFLTTADRVDAFYKETGRLPSEHALIDDNGDALGTPPDWFRGIRVTKRAKGGEDPDGFHAHQIALIPSELEKKLTPEQRLQRDSLEEELENLRKRKNDLDEDEYYAALEGILQQLSDIYLSNDGDKTNPSSDKSDDS
jgi:hypothetical protein